MLAKRPRDRQQTMGEVIADLTRAVPCPEQVAWRFGEQQPLAATISLQLGEPPRRSTRTTRGQVAATIDLAAPLSPVPAQGETLSQTSGQGETSKSPVIVTAGTAGGTRAGGGASRRGRRRLSRRARWIAVACVVGLLAIIAVMWSSRDQVTTSGGDGSPVPPTENAADELAGEPLDLLAWYQSPRFDSSQAAPGWQLRNGELHGDGGVETNNLPLKQVTATAYTIEAEITLQAGNDAFYLVLPVVDRFCFFAVNSYPRAGRSHAGFGHIAGQTVAENPHSLGQDVYPPGQRLDLSVRVSVSGDRAMLLGTVNDETISVTAPLVDLSIPAEYAWPREGALLGIGSVNSAYTVHALLLREGITPSPATGERRIDLVTRVKPDTVEQGDFADVSIVGSTLTLDASGNSPQLWLDFLQVEAEQLTIRTRLRIFDRAANGWAKLAFMHGDEEYFAQIATDPQEQWLEIVDSADKTTRYKATAEGALKDDDFSEIVFAVERDRLRFFIDGREVLTAPRKKLQSGWVAINVGGWKCVLERPTVTLGASR